MTTLASIIKAKRKEMGLTGTELYRLCGVHFAIIYKLENNMEVPDKSRWVLVETLKVPFNSKLFAKKIREKREVSGWSIAQLSKITKVSTSVIYLLESNKKLPSMVLCYKLAKKLKLSLEDFV